LLSCDFPVFRQGSKGGLSFFLSWIGVEAELGCG
jgi:hypothetical protein